MLATASSEFLRNLADGVGLPVFVVAPRGTNGLRLLTANGRWAEVFQLDAERLQNVPLETVLPAGAREPLATHCWVSLRSGEPVEYETPLRRPSCAERWWRVVLMPLRDEQGVVRRVLGTALEVTDRVRTEQALRESEARFRDLIEGSIQGIVIHRAGVPLFANRAYAELYGFRSVEQVLSLESLDCLIPPAERASAQRRWLQVISGEREVVKDRVRHQRIDGEPLWVDILARRVNWMGEPAMQAVVVDVTQTQRLEQELRLRATTDDLTGLWSRRHFMHLVAQELRRARRYRTPVSVIIADVDHFKRINDRLGHQAGDHALRTLAKWIREALRASDIPCRLGGEEFSVLLPQTDLATAAEVAERLRRQVANRVLRYRGRQLELTVSIGCGAWCPTERTLDAALSRADRALYRAKHAGRNRVELE